MKNQIVDLLLELVVVVLLVELHDIGGLVRAVAGGLLHDHLSGEDAHRPINDAQVLDAVRVLAESALARIRIMQLSTVRVLSRPRLPSRPILILKQQIL